MKTFKKMLQIEGKLSIRDMNMIIFAIIMPLIVLVILGIIYGTKPAFEGAQYSFIEQSFGALSTISICAGGVMGLPILVSDYRERKILKKFQVTPISPAMILAVHLVIYAIYAVISLIILAIVARCFWGAQIKGSYLIFFAAWLLVLLSMLSIGMLVGGVAKNSKRASVIASILYFPMLVFSGATLPYEVMPVLMQKLVDIMPLTQGIKVLKAATVGGNFENIVIPSVAILVMTGICITGSIKFFRWE